MALRAPLLTRLHWHHAIYRISVKLSTLTYRALSTQQPPYLASVLHLSNIPRQLRQPISQQRIVPKIKVYLGKHAFSVASLRFGNVLPIILKTSKLLIPPKNDVFIQNCISAINLRWSLVLVMTFLRPYSRLCLMILFRCASELRFLRI